MSNKCCIFEETPVFCHELTKFIAQEVTNAVTPEWEKAIQEERKNEEPLSNYEKEWLYSFNYAMIDGFVEDVCVGDQNKIQAIADFTVKYDKTFIHKLAFGCVNKRQVVVDSVTREKFEANTYNKVPVQSKDKQSELREFVSSYSNEDPVSFEEFKIQRVTHSNFTISSKYSSLGIHLKSSGTNEMIQQEETGDIITAVFAIASPVAEVFTAIGGTAVGLSSLHLIAEGRNIDLKNVTAGITFGMQLVMINGGASGGAIGGASGGAQIKKEIQSQQTGAGWQFYCGIAIA